VCQQSDFAARDFYDVWLPILSPSQELLDEVRKARTDGEWFDFVKKFRREMDRPESRYVLDLLAALAHQTSISLGCYCENENQCHPSILTEFLPERGASPELEES